MSLTKLEVGIARADMITSTENPFHYECDPHSLEQTKMLRDSKMLQE